MRNETKVFIEENFDTYTTKIWVRNYNGNKVENLTLNDGTITSTVITIGACSLDLKPFIQLPTNYFSDIFPVIIQALSNKGFKAEFEYVNEGKLIQMTEHKNDLRDVLKLVIEKLPNNKP